MYNKVNFSSNGNLIIINQPYNLLRNLFLKLLIIYIYIHIVINYIIKNLGDLKRPKLALFITNKTIKYIVYTKPHFFSFFIKFRNKLNKTKKLNEILFLVNILKSILFHIINQNLINVKIFFIYLKVTKFALKNKCIKNLTNL
jgi:hypothetical protein